MVDLTSEVRDERLQIVSLLHRGVLFFDDDHGICAQRDTQFFPVVFHLCQRVEDLFSDFRIRNKPLRGPSREHSPRFNFYTPNVFKTRPPLQWVGMIIEQAWLWFNTKDSSN